jgi:hypothetical protein
MPWSTASLTMMAGELGAAARGLAGFFPAKTSFAHGQ